MKKETTLEEKIKTKMDEYYPNKNAGTTPIFEDGAKWLLSELNPVMEEMKEALSTSNEWFKKLDASLPDCELKGIIQAGVQINSKALAKYNELFKH